jgi:thiol-disulfide isomerase/thioredoxin
MKIALLAIAIVLSACDDKGASGAVPAARVVSVAADRAHSRTSELCDVAKPSADAPSFVMPPVEGDLGHALMGPRWINVWATWCPPCIDELPLLRKLEAAFSKAGKPVPLVLLSVDTEADRVAKYQAQHPEALGSLRLTDFGKLEAWLVSLGLDRGATLPVHVFIDAQNKVVCARTGALRASDASAIEQLFQAR